MRIQEDNSSSKIKIVSKNVNNISDEAEATYENLCQKSDSQKVYVKM